MVTCLWQPPPCSHLVQAPSGKNPYITLLATSLSLSLSHTHTHTHPLIFSPLVTVIGMFHCMKSPQFYFKILHDVLNLISPKLCILVFDECFGTCKRTQAFEKCGSHSINYSYWLCLMNSFEARYKRHLCLVFHVITLHNGWGKEGERGREREREGGGVRGTKRGREYKIELHRPRPESYCVCQRLWTPPRIHTLQMPNVNPSSTYIYMYIHVLCV